MWPVRTTWASSQQGDWVPRARAKRGNQVEGSHVTFYDLTAQVKQPRFYCIHFDRKSLRAAHIQREENSTPPFGRRDGGSTRTCGTRNIAEALLDHSRFGGTCLRLEAPWRVGTPSGRWLGPGVQNASA